MNMERFEILAECYGGDVSRWPSLEREAAAALMLARPDWARRVLAEAAGLDACLMADGALQVSQALMDRVVAGAPAPRRKGWLAWILPTGLGAGLAAASVAGFIVGAQASSRTDPGLEASPTAVVTFDDDYSFDADEEV